MNLRGGAKTTHRLRASLLGSVAPVHVRRQLCISSAILLRNGLRGLATPRRNNSVLIGLRLHLKAGNQTLKQSIPVLMG